MQRDAFFLDGPGGGRFCLVTRPRTEPIGGLLYLHPFSEELNRTRRMAALGARAFAERGWLVLQPDLYGCGDSAGGFGDATWTDWLDDVTRSWSWLRAHCAGPLALWTLRAGSLLAADWLARSGTHAPLLLWQPVSGGREHLTRFLRLRAANEMLDGKDAGTALARMRAELEAGQAVEVAGYALSPALARGLDAAALRLPESWHAPVALFEVEAGERTTLSPGVDALVRHWTGAGTPVAAEVVRGPKFWQTREIEVAPELLERSAARLDWLLR